MPEPMTKHPAPTPTLQKNPQHRWAIFLLIILGLVIYINTLPNEMFWDDDDFILKNRYIKDWQYFPQFFSENLISGSHFISNYWRPMLLTVFSIEWHLWKTWTPGWHMVNTAFHIADSALLYYVLYLLFNRWGLALGTALLFLAHPVQTETIVYVNSLGDSLSVFFIFLGLLFYIRFRLFKNASMINFDYLRACLMYPLALMSKESGFILPALIILSDFFIIQKDLLLSERFKRVFKSTWPFILMAIIYLILRGTVLNFSNSFNFYNDVKTPLTESFFIRLQVFFKALSEYSSFIFWPLDLHVERELPLPQSPFELQVLWGGALFIGMLVLAFKYWKKIPIITIGVLWFFAAIAPTSNLLVLINATIYEHFLYVPVIGIFLICVWLGINWSEKLNITKTARTIFILLLVALSILSIKRNSEWRTAIGFYESLLKHAPNSYRVVNNLGMEYAENGVLDKAEATYNRAIAIDPENPVGYHNLANLYKDTGRKDAAIGLYEKVLTLNPEFIFTHKALAQLYYEKGDFAKARNIMEDFFNRADEKLETLEVLFKLALAQKDYSSAYQYLKAASQLDPNNPGIKESLRSLEKLKN